MGPIFAASQNAQPAYAGLANAGTENEGSSLLSLLGFLRRTTVD